MASNKRRGYLDQSTRNHLKGIEAALAHVISKPRQEDEFTARELFDKAVLQDDKITMPSILCKLNRMRDAGLCTSRNTKINGRVTNLYRMISHDCNSQRS